MAYSVWASFNGMTELVHIIGAIEKFTFEEDLESIANHFTGDVRQQYSTMIYQTPESPSYKRTWHLYQDISIKKLDKDSVRVRSEATSPKGTKYGLFVEYGTRRMAPRPAWRVALANTKKYYAWRRVINRKMAQAGVI